MLKMRNGGRALVCGLALLILSVSAVDGRQRGASADEAIRFQASQRALDHLVAVAELHTGVTVVSFDVDATVGCRTGYGSSVCPIPGATRLEALHKAGRDDVEPEVRRLHPVADADGDGFLNDEEGERFAVLVHFGQQLSYLVTSARRSTDELARLTRLSPEKLRSRLAEYKEFVARAGQLGVSFVAAPSIK